MNTWTLTINKETVEIAPGMGILTSNHSGKLIVDEIRDDYGWGLDSKNELVSFTKTDIIGLAEKRKSLTSLKEQKEQIILENTPKEEKPRKKISVPVERVAKKEIVKQSGEVKVDYTLVPQFALREVAKAMTLGQGKYPAFNYSDGIELRKYMAAAMRHITAKLLGADENEEDGTGCDHIAHAICNLMMALDNQITGKAKDDRNPLYLKLNGTTEIPESSDAPVGDIEAEGGNKSDS
jgi:hypothetical protein